MNSEVKKLILKDRKLTSEDVKNLETGLREGKNINDILAGKITQNEIETYIMRAIFINHDELRECILNNISDLEKKSIYNIESQNNPNDNDFFYNMLVSSVVSDKEMAMGKAEYYNYKYVRFEDINIGEAELDILKKFEKNYIKTNKFMAIGTDKDGIKIAMTNPENAALRDELILKLNKKININVISESDFESLYNIFLNKISFNRETEDELGYYDDNENLTVDELKNNDNPIVKLINNIIHDSVRKGASDIHIEPYKSSFILKNRIDGVLIDDYSNISKSYHLMIVSRIKILSNLNIAEHRLPQDGRFKMRIDDRDVDFRVSIIPTSFGESVVIRILDRKESALDLGILGFNDDEKKIIIENSLQPHGMILITGPTGSGKTTTLYAVLKEIKKKEEKIITIEDPIEYQFNNIVQMPVNEKTRLTFAKGLRAILRQDPDKIMIGEIRDKETAEIAVQAALTGHLVISTVHANSTVEAIGRLINIGVDVYQFATALNLIVGQRLMRKYCADCNGRECKKCDSSGYKGRIGVYELFELSNNIKQMVIDGESILKVKEIAIKEGMTELKHKAREKVTDGITSKEEYERVIGRWNSEHA